MSINSVLGTARLALTAQETTMATTAHNIANAQTAGYTRQRAEVTPNQALYTPWGAVGTGVVVSDVTRARDTMLDVNYRSQSAASNAYGTRNDLLTDISNVYGEPSDSGLANTLDQFWNAWSDLANSPDSTAAKSVVQQRGAQVASTLNRYAKGLGDVEAGARDKLSTSIDMINRDTAQIAALNRQITAAESGGHTAGDLRDTRDNLLDQLSALVPVTTVERTDGSVNVYIANSTVVDGADSRQISLQNNAGTLALQLSGNSGFMPPPGGAVGAMMHVIDVDIPDQRAQLDTFSQQLVSTVNTIHRTGWTAAGDTLGGANWDATTPPTGSNVDFFDAGGTTAGTIALSAQVKNDASYVAGGNIQNGTGNNAVANQLSQLRAGTTSILEYGSTTQQTSFGEYYRDQVTRLGIATDDANSSATVYDTLTTQADTQRQSANGVSTDDELIAMTKHQQAYAAAAKIVTTADEMAQTLLDMIR